MTSEKAYAKAPGIGADTGPVKVTWIKIIETQENTGDPIVKRVLFKATDHASMPELVTYHHFILDNDSKFTLADKIGWLKIMIDSVGAVSNMDKLIDFADISDTVQYEPVDNIKIPDATGTIWQSTELPVLHGQSHSRAEDIKFH